VVFVYDRNNQGELPFYYDVFQATTVTALISREAEVKGRFQILGEQLFVFGDSDGGAQNCKFLKGYIPLKGKPSVWDSTGDPTYADMEKGTVFAIFLSENNAYTITVSGRSRYTYADM